MQSVRVPVLVMAGFAALASTGHAAVIGEPDRRTFAEWAEANGLPVEEVEARYAASGEVACYWVDDLDRNRSSFSSAQVTARADLITMSGHVFIDLASCEDKAPARSCTFSTERNGETLTAALDEIVDLGPPCAGNFPPPLRERLLQDWAVIRLAHPIDVVPYAVDGADAMVAPGLKVTSVVRSQDYLVPLDDGTTEHPETIGECTVRDTVVQFGRTTYFATDCDGAQRSSGGSVLDTDDDGPPRLLGIWAASTEERYQLDEAVARIIEAGAYRDDLVNMAEYDPANWSSRHVPVAGGFLRAILRAVAETDRARFEASGDGDDAVPEVRPGPGPAILNDI